MDVIEINEVREIINKKQNKNGIIEINYLHATFCLIRSRLASSSAIS